MCLRGTMSLEVFAKQKGLEKPLSHKVTMANCSIALASLFLQLSPPQFIAQGAWEIMYLKKNSPQFPVVLGCLANQLVVFRLSTNQPLLDQLNSCPYVHLQVHLRSIQTNLLGSGFNAGELLFGSWLCHFLTVCLGKTSSTSLKLNFHLKMC